MPTMLAFKVIGTIGLASYAMAYASTKMRHVSYMRYKLIALSADSLPDMPRGYSFRELGADELAGFTINIDRAAQAERFEQGMICLGTFDRAGALIGIIWLARRIHSEGDLHLRYHLPENAAWDTGLWIPEDKRMGRAFSAVWGSVKQWLRQEGLEWSMSSIADYNISSILAHRRLGSVRLRYIVVLRVGRMQMTIGARPKFCVIGKTRMPSVDLKPA